MALRKILVVYGTRPEIIKLFPVIFELKNNPHFDLKIINTGQHAHMTKELEQFFKIKPDYFLDIMLENQTLNDTLSNVLKQLDPVLEKEKPDIAIVQGDTTTVLGTSIACFHRQIDVAHVEAGLRSFDIYQPFPEEYNRRAVSLIAKYNFCPTVNSFKNLENERVEGGKLFITGNTVVDAVNSVIAKLDLKSNTYQRKKILITAHRRENHFDGIENICKAVLKVVEMLPDITFVWPVHPNPNVKGKVYELLGNIKSVRLLNPLPYQKLITEIYESHIIWTDSGGIQEEAPSFKKPVLILRNVTERPEVVESGFGKLVGTDTDKIVYSTLNLFNSPEEYQRMISGSNPFGDGSAARKIVDVLEQH